MLDRREAHLLLASDTGRAAAARGLAVSDVVAMHHTALANVIARDLGPAPAELVRRAAEFLIESVLPFELMSNPLRTHALGEIALAAGRVLDSSALAILSVDHARALLRADLAALYWAVPGSDALRLLAQSSEDALDAPTAGDVDRDRAAIVIQHGQPLIEQDDRELGLPRPIRGGFPSALAVPLLIGGRPVGAITVRSVRSRRFTAEDSRLLSLFAAEVAPALRAGEAFAGSELRRNEAEALAEAARVVAEGSVAGETLRSILEAAQRVVPSDVALLSVPCAEPDQLEVVAVLGGSPDWIGRRHSASEGIVGRAFAERLARIVDDPDEQEAVGNWWPQARSAVAVPVVSHDSVVGVLHLRASGPERFTARHVPLLEAFAPYVAIALENDRRMRDATFRALHDGLTGLPNRTLLNDRIESAILSAARSSSKVALLVIDLDRFKEINDVFGHHAGDEMLRQVAVRIRSSFRAGDTVARLGGDEFAVVLDPADAEGASEAAQKVIAALELPFTAAGQQLSAPASIGIALYPEHAVDGQTLLRRADIALYVAKRTRGMSVIFSSQHEQHSADRLAIANEFGPAIQGGELVLHYQPVMDLAGGRIAGLEALVRWQHPRRGLLPPGEFLPVVGEVGLMRALSSWVLGEVGRQLREWQRSGISLRVAMNITAADLLDRTLVDDVADRTREFGVDPALLQLEITESAIITDPERALESLRRLRRLGVGISIDDFGTGYSSLAYLHRLPIDEVKIDRSFVSPMRGDGRSAAMVRAIIEMCHLLGMQVVAEGVETAEGAAILARFGCDRIQGFFVAPGLPAVDVKPWIDQWHKRHPPGA